MKNIKQTFKRLCACAALSALAWQGDLSAQQLKMTLAKPVVLPAQNVTPRSFTASWYNVKAETGTDIETSKMFHRLHVMHEFEAKADGPYPVARFEITGSKEATPEQPSWLDAFGSQTGWFSANVSGVPNAIKIGVPAMYRMPGMPEDVYAMMGNMVTPPLNLSNNGGKFTFSFTARVTAGDGPAKVIVFGYGEETQGATDDSPQIKEVIIPNDGKVHTNTIEMEGGTWCHMVAMQFHSPHELELIDEIKVEQNLKKGDRGYRSAWKGGIVGTHESLKPQKPDLSEGEYNVRYTFDVGAKEEEGLIDPRVLDFEAVKKAGERVSYRVGIQEKAETPEGLMVLRSVYSDPAYFDGQDQPSKHIYLGYTSPVEAPVYTHALPGKPVFSQGIYGGAIELGKALLDKYHQFNAIGVRVCVAAVGQIHSNNKFVAGENSNLPSVFIAKSLPGVSAGAEQAEYLRIKTTDLTDGWNEIIFDEPLQIDSNTKLYAGVTVQDKSNSGLAIALGQKELDAQPNAPLLFAADESSMASGLVYKPVDSNKRGALIQLIIDETSDPGAVEEIDASKVEVSVQGKSIVVRGAYSDMRLYTLSGQLLSSTNALEQGCYIVSVLSPNGTWSHHKVTVE